MKLAYPGLILGLIVSGCYGGGGGGVLPDGGTDGGPMGCPVGSERCSCTPGGACDPGLTCASGVCVDLGATSGSGGSGGSGGAGGGTADPAAMLNATVILPNEGEPLIDPEIDETVVVESLPISQAQPVMAGSTVDVSIPFSAASGNVVAAGIRFGTSGPIRTVMLPAAEGQSAATLDFQMQIPASVCADLANICHDIQCYEFAVTDVGTVSRENIMDMALLCGNCDEPSCQALLPPGACMLECMGAEDCEPGETCSMGLCVGEGALRITLSWSAMTDLDLHVMTPTGAEISYSNRMADSGELDRDNTSGGSGSVENVFFTAPPVGTYTYFVENYDGNEAASFTLQVFKEGELVATQNGNLPATSDALSPEYTVSVP